MKGKNLRQNEVDGMVSLLEKNGRLAQEQSCMQHGTTTLLEHSRQVACLSLEIADAAKLRVNRGALVRGALLHDYFLYDWHTPHDGHDLHGFTHPRTALKNAAADFQLAPVERDVISRHMFPLTLVPPATKEGWIVCIADKLCAARETAAPFVRKKRRHFVL